MRILALAALLTALLPAAAGATTADLRVTVWPEGKDGKAPHDWTLRCGPAAGTLPRRAAACRALQRLANPFAPVPGDTACATIYGGPQVALVRGTFRGHRISATFSRVDSCQIERWGRVAFLFR